MLNRRTELSGRNYRVLDLIFAKQKKQKERKKKKVSSRGAWGTQLHYAK